MELLMILFFMTVYVILAMMFIFFVRKKTELKLYRWLAVVFVFLLPTWDVVLGYLVYYPACMFIPKVAIYETAETEGIYYEGINNEVYKGELHYENKVKQVEKVSGLYFWYKKKDYQYLESKITQKSECADFCNKIKIEPVIYRCIPLAKELPDYTPVRCFPVEKAESRYLVKVHIVKAGVTEINFKKIIDRSTGKLIAENNEVIFSGFSPPVPFFNWIWKFDGTGMGYMYSPHASNDDVAFEYRVLKPIK